MNDLRELLLAHHVEIAPEGHRHARLNWIQVDCPWCGPGSGKYHLGINQRTGHSNCWKCGYHSLYSALVMLTGLSYRKLKPFLKKELYYDFEPARARGQLEMPQHRELMKVHRRYLESRGFDPDELVKLWQIKATDMLPPELPWRIVIPIIFRGETVSWTTRAIDDEASGPRYISARPEQESIDHKSILYGVDYCHNTIVIHEGPTDVWRTGPGAVALFGAMPTTPQLLVIAKFPVRIICLDVEPQAQANADRICESLSAFPGETIKVTLETGKDASSASDAEIRYLRRLMSEMV